MNSLDSPEEWALGFTERLEISNCAPHFMPYGGVKLSWRSRGFVSISDALINPYLK